MESTEPWVVDRTQWIRKPGKTYPWDAEGDKENWTTAAGLPGMMVRNRMGAWCGYAAVDSGHPAYRLDYDTVAAMLSSGVHGGLTYAAACQGHVCHVPEPGQPDDVWWLGFDCAHGGDYVPRVEGLAFWDRERGTWEFGARDYHDDLAYARGQGLLTPLETYRDAGYVRGQVEDLAAQLAALAAAPPVVSGDAAAAGQ